MKDGSKITLQKVGEDYILGGDMLLTIDQLNQIKQNSVTGTGKQRLQAVSKERSTFTGNFLKLWQGGVIYYTLSSPANQSAISAAISYYNTNTQLRFLPRTNQADYVDFQPAPITPGAAGEAYLGRKGGPQTIKLASSATFETVLHEMGHTIGLMHEQNRFDRDAFINVNFGNINPNYTSQYQIYSGVDGFEIGPFDYESIMMYQPYYSVVGYPGNTTAQITRKDGLPYYGQISNLTPEDIAGINYLYFNNTFCKIRRVLVNYVEDQYRTYATYDTFVDFYSNPQCTIPKVINSPVRLNIGVYNTTYDIPDRPTVTINSTYQTLPAGANSYALGVNVDQDVTYTYDGSTVSGSYINSAGINGGVGYVAVH